MQRSHIRVYVHLVWTTWDREPSIPKALTPRLYAVIRAACEKAGCEVFAVGGIPDHVHALVAMPATLTIADLAHDAKGADDSMAVHLTSVVRELDLIRAAHPEYFSHETARTA